MLLTLLALSTAHAWQCSTPGQLRADTANIVQMPIAQGTGDSLRDPFNVDGWLQTTEHFALRWGPEATYTDSLMANIGDVLEEVWTHEVDTMGYPAPAGTDAFLLNVYVGSTGGGTPSVSGFATAFVSIDVEGFPYMVLSPELVDAVRWDGEEAARGVLAHEFFHTIQASIGSLTEDPRSAWFWEASASWMVQEVAPEHPDVGAYVGAFALSPHRSLEQMAAQPQTWLDLVQPYGAEIFVSYLEEFHGGPEIVRDLWLDAGPETIVASWLETEFERTGVSWGETVLDFRVQNTDYSAYAYASTYRESADSFARSFPDDDRRSTVFLPSEGTDGEERPQAALLPEAYGANYIVLQTPLPGRMRVALQPDALGDLGTESQLHAAFVRVGDFDIDATPVSAEGVDVELTGEEDRVVLVVTAVPDTVTDGERFGYRFTMAYDELYTSSAQRDTTTDEPGCGCSATPPPGLGWLAFGLGLPLLRRRSTTGGSHP